MPDWLLGMLGLLLGVAAGAGLMLLAVKRQRIFCVEEARRKAKAIHEEQDELARREAEGILSAASREAERIRQAIEGEFLEKKGGSQGNRGEDRPKGGAGRREGEEHKENGERGEEALLAA